MGDGTAAGNPVGTGGSATCPEGATYVKRLGVNDSVYVIRSCANGRVDYVGASSVTLIGPGEAAGNFREIEIQNGKMVDVNYR